MVQQSRRQSAIGIQEEAKALLAVTTQAGCEPALASGRTNHPTVADAVHAAGSAGNAKRDELASESSSSAFVSEALQAMAQGSAPDFVSVGSVSSRSAAERLDASGGDQAAEEQPFLPSALELAAITPIEQFRKRAVELCLVVFVPKMFVSGTTPRSKADIVADYRQKLDESPAAPAASEPAASCSFAMCPPANGSQGHRCDKVDDLGSVLGQVDGSLVRHSRGAPPPEPPRKM